MSNKKKTTTPAMLSAYIERSIYFIRDRKVMLDTDLANLYGVTTFKKQSSATSNDSPRISCFSSRRKSSKL